MKLGIEKHVFTIIPDDDKFFVTRLLRELGFTEKSFEIEKRHLSYYDLAFYVAAIARFATLKDRKDILDELSLHKYIY